MAEYICLDCKDMFDDPLLEYGDLCEYMGAPERIMEQVCPNCHSENFVEMSDITIRLESVMSDYGLQWMDMLDIAEENI